MVQAEAIPLDAALEAGRVELSPELRAAALGDEDAFGCLVRRHQRMVYSIAWRFFADVAVAEDVAQEVFLQLFQNLKSVESDSHLLFWLRQVTSRKCIDHARWLEKRRHQSLDAVAEFVPATETREPDLLENQRLRRLVAGLPQKLRAVVVLRFQEELAPAEISKMLGWPVSSVKSRLHRALKLLRERL